MTKYVATINTPGYLPMDDDPPVFDTAKEAWEYLRDERQAQEDAAAMEDDSIKFYTETLDDLYAHARWADSGLVCDFEAVGTVVGDTPGYDGSHDLGLAYSVTEVDDPESLT